MTTDRTLRDCLHASLAPWMDSGQVAVTQDAHGAFDVAPTADGALAFSAYEQSVDEISLFFSWKAADDGLTVNISGGGRDRVLDETEAYVRAIALGCCELMVDPRSSRRGRITFRLEDGREEVHHCNVLFKASVGRGVRWKLLRYASYSVTAVER